MNDLNHTPAVLGSPALSAETRARFLKMRLATLALFALAFAAASVFAR
jgi:hypothetical protein